MPKIVINTYDDDGEEMVYGTELELPSEFCVEAVFDKIFKKLKGR